MLLGNNGAGKTTLIRIITGLIQSDEGTVSINGFDINKQGIDAKKQLALIPDNPEIYNKITGMQWLYFIGEIYGVRKTELIERIKKYSNIFQMESALHDQIETYSYGMKHKISIISALIHKPKIMIFDEPLQGLDPDAVYNFKLIMKEHTKQGGIILFSTHLLDIAEKIGDRFAVLNNSKIVDIEKMQILKYKNLNLEEYYLELLKS